MRRRERLTLAAALAFGALALGGCEGAQGPPGPAGDAGLPGESGEQGEQGPQGPQGPPGTPGEAGEDGEDGTDGQDGLSGEQGAPGMDGEDGQPGTDGQDGEDGQPGMDGQDGEDGEDGADGQDGADGRASLVRTTPEAAGANCVAGGVRVDAGIDDNGNGQLDAGEIDSTAYVCNGPQGPGGGDGGAALVATRPEPAGGNCPAGGVAVQVGFDDNGNGVLDAAEVDSTSYVCNAPAADGSVGPQNLRDQDDADALAGATRIDGDLRVLGTDVTRLVLPSVTAINGRIEISGNRALDAIELPALVRVTGGVDIDDNAATSIRLPALESVGGHLVIGAHPDLETLSLPSVQRTAGAYIISTRSNADVDLGDLPEFVGGDAYIGDNAGLRTLQVDPGFVGGDLTVFNNQNLATARAQGSFFVAFDLFILGNPALVANEIMRFAAGIEGDGDRILITGGAN